MSLSDITAQRLFFSDYLKLLPKDLAKQREFAFFSSIQLRNGTTKTTAYNRMDDLNSATTAYLSKLKKKPEKFLDVAISSGVSTGEWYNCLVESGLSDVQMTATDLTLNAHLIEVNRYFRVLVQSCNFPLQFDIFNIPIRASKYGRKGYFNGEYLIAWLLKKFFLRVSKKNHLPECLSSINQQEKFRNDSQGVFNCGDIRIRNINLISPSVSNLTALTFFNDDLGCENTADLIKKFDVIRAANILNIGYFPDEILTAFLKRLKARLKGPGSLLIVCRTNILGENNATLFKLNDAERFEAVLRIGQGSEIENLVVSAA